ncbi:hypothetical protein LY41_003443 [Prauserella halophila]|nr:hypothetical protein [Prauserella halophila]
MKKPWQRCTQHQADATKSSGILAQTQEADSIVHQLLAALGNTEASSPGAWPTTSR